MFVCKVLTNALFFCIFAVEIGKLSVYEFEYATNYSGGALDRRVDTAVLRSLHSATRPDTREPAHRVRRSCYLCRGSVRNRLHLPTETGTVGLALALALALAVNY